MRSWLSFSLLFLFWFSPAVAAEPAYDSLPPELVQLRDEGKLTVRALWAWRLVPELTPAMALEFHEHGYDLLAAGRKQLRQWLDQSDDGQNLFSGAQRHLLGVLLALMEVEPVFDQDGQAEVTADSPVVSDALYRGNLARTGVFAGPVPQQTPTLVWKFELTKEFCRDPVVSDDTVYIGSVDGHMYAIDLVRGKLRWKFNAEDWIDYSPLVSAGTVYFGNVMGDKSGDRHLFAVDAATGNEKWRFMSKYYGLNSSPAIVNGAVYFGAGDNHLYALDAPTGAQNWNFKGKDSVGTPAIADNTAYFTHGNLLTAVELGTDAENWTFNTQTKITTCPVVADGIVYCGADDDFHIYAVDRQSGQEKWKFKTGRILYPPAVHDSVVYAVSSDNLHALDARTGAEQWTVNTVRNRLTAPVIVDNTIIVGAGKFLLALDRTNGREKWRFEAGDTMTTPAVSDGAVYFWSTDGCFYAVR